GVRLPLPEGSEPLVLGAVVDGMSPDDPNLAGEKNDPMMPIAWTKNYQGGEGKTSRVFTSTMACAQDFENSAFRRLLVNACYWAMGLEDKISPKSSVELVGDYQALPFKHNGFRHGVKPSDHELP